MTIYVQQLSTGGWGNAVGDEQFAGISEADINASGFYRFEPGAFAIPDFNQIPVFTFELRDNVVYRTCTLQLKEGQDLVIAIKNKWEQIRQERNNLLNKCDYTQMADYTISPEKKAAWAVYRQQLRDITAQTDPFAIVWPTDPNGLNGSIGVARV